jgi:fermentation-respiration switch protein FrsA (DUF1100 family)
MRSRGRVVAAAELAFLAALSWTGLRLFEKANIYHPSRDFTIVPGTFGLAHEEVALAASDGVRLHGWFLPAARGPLAGQGLVLLYCHGNAGNISDRVSQAALFHRLGLSVLLFDYRGYGKSAGSPSEEGTYRDGEAAYRFLAEAKGFPPDKIVIYGESLGNGIALETALRHAPKALILDSAFTSIADMGREIFPWLPVRLMVTMRYDNLAKIPRVHCPVLVMHGRQDRVVPFRMGRALFAAAPQPKEFLELKGGHDDGCQETGEACTNAVQAFLRRYAR